MKILSIDAGGTYCRFASFIANTENINMVGNSLAIETKKPGLDSFESILEEFRGIKPDCFGDLGDYDLIVVALAGPVLGNLCDPPNINWEFDLDNFQFRDTTLLVNDFVAQSYGLIELYKSESLPLIRQGKSPRKTGNVGIVGAGTGLGHCVAVPIDSINHEDFLYVESEAGHSLFPFVGSQEKELEQFILNKLAVEYCVKDQIVSGKGLALVHEFLSGEELASNEICAGPEKFNETLKWFSILYGRVCRDYCLTNFVTRALIITGGVASNLPIVVENDHFWKEFVSSAGYEYLLNGISVYLNPGLEAGLLGAARYGYSKMEGLANE